MIGIMGGTIMAGLLGGAIFDSIEVMLLLSGIGIGIAASWQLHQEAKEAKQARNKLGQYPSYKY